MVNALLRVTGTYEAFLDDSDLFGIILHGVEVLLSICKERPDDISSGKLVLIDRT